jgi:hypothetical protein
MKLKIFNSFERFGDLANITKAKEDLVRKLRLLVNEERRQLERDLAIKLDQLEMMKKRHQVGKKKEQESKRAKEQQSKREREKENKRRNFVFI